MQSYDKIENEIIATLDKIATGEDWRSWNTGKWTREIKDRIGPIGEDQGCSVWAEKCRYSENGEWLFDMTWLYYSKNKRLLEVPLALESEWAPGDINDDFQKLLLARAHHRVMIFDRRTLDEAMAIVTDLIAQVKAFKGTQPDDRYLFAFWCSKNAKFDYHLYVAAAEDLTSHAR